LEGCSPQSLSPIPADGRYWHKADNPTAPAFVRFWNKADKDRFWPGTVCPLMTHERHLPAPDAAPSGKLVGAGTMSVFAEMTIGGPSMPAYLIAEHTITDAAKFEEYRVKVGPLIAKHGGRYITKGGSHVVLEKDNAVWQPGPSRNR
jgi:hypothetical protein